MRILIVHTLEAPLANCGVRLLQSAAGERASAGKIPSAPTGNSGRADRRRVATRAALRAALRALSVAAAAVTSSCLFCAPLKIVNSIPVLLSGAVS